MSQFTAIITRTTSDGKYAYLISQNGTGYKDVNGLASLGAAMDGVKTDIAAIIPGGETVQKIGMTVSSA